MSNIEMRAPIIHALHWIATMIEVVGVATIVAGVLIATVLFARQGLAREWDLAFHGSVRNSV